MVLQTTYPRFDYSPHKILVQTMDVITIRKCNLTAILLFLFILQTATRPQDDVIADEFKCQALCGKTNPCPIGDRCVLDGCSYLCYKLPPQDSRCPKIRSHSYCEDQCSHRPAAPSYCSDNEICCFNGCGNECMLIV